MMTILPFADHSAALAHDGDPKHIHGKTAEAVACHNGGLPGTPQAAQAPCGVCEADVRPLSEAERAMLRDTWPVELVADPARSPRIVEDPAEFLTEMLVGDHLEEFYILPNGCEKLDVACQQVLPEDLQEVLEGCRNVRDFALRLRNERPEVQQKYRADVEYTGQDKETKDIFKKEKCDLGKRLEEAFRMEAEGLVDPKKMYVGEMRHREVIQHPIGGDKVKTICRRDVKDLLGPYAVWNLYWDRYDEGVFVGGRGAGKGLHVDQVLWSNVGRNWKGYKLVAAWPKGDVSKEVADTFKDVLFTPPLSEAEVACLRRAAKIALLRPGDVYFFSGGIAHTTLCVSEDICLAAYESFVTLNPVHVEHFLHTDDSEGPYCLDKLAMPPEDLYDTKEDCLDQLEDAADQYDQGGPTTVPDKQVSRIWTKLLQTLHSNEVFQARLRDNYAKAVDVLAANDRWFKAKIPDKCVRVAEACDTGADSGKDGEPLRKRRRRRHALLNSAHYPRTSESPSRGPDCAEARDAGA
eukprot:TRINITY_DN26559_c0_g2_i1.p1 TRINITY_DN26559_c0_g2~~TRINITY_DN26559_c0_g2_i1.p1  ORF type:complete len:522 (+),score=126.38 TRINITY_DN26559_c0_g2_i1:37-1602(+)